MSTERDPVSGRTNGRLPAAEVASAQARSAKKPRFFRQASLAFSPRDRLSHPHEYDQLTMEKGAASPDADSNGNETCDYKKTDMVRAEGSERGSGLIASLRRYPKSVFFMLGNEFCERFSFYGMRAILLLYLIHEHQMSDSTASLIYHLFVCLAYISPLFGSIAADNYFGRFNVILWVSIVYVLGHVLLSIGAIPGLVLGLRSTLDFSGLAVIALATGGIKPCVSAFAADQFPEELHREREQFFSFFYFAINAGSLLAILLTPMLRGYVKCFGSEYCFPLAFGVPGVLMLVAFLLFVGGWRTYTKPPAAKGNIVWKVFRCIGYGARKKLSATLWGKKKAESAQKHEHWLDYATPKYSPSLIEGVKSMLSVIVLFLPVVFFWALFDQQGSTWILQANRMNGRVGRLTILPDQMNIFNPLIVLFCVPLFEGVVYPAIRKMNINITPLRKMAAGGILTALSFVIAGFLQLEVNKTLEVLPSHNQVFVQLYHNTDCKFLDATPNEWSKLTLNASSLSVEPTQACSVSKPISLNATKDGQGYFLGILSANNQSKYEHFSYDIKKTSEGKTRIYILADESTFKNTYLYAFDEDGDLNSKEVPVKSGSFVDIKPGPWDASVYTLRIGGPNCTTRTENDQCDKVIEVEGQMGAAHVLMLWKEDGVIKHSPLHKVVRENSVNLLWQLPQFLTITVGEVLISVTGLEFSYSQAAPNMRSFLQAMWLMTVSIGNFIDMGISGSHIVKEPAAEFFVYAALMLAVMLVFIVLSLRYKYVDPKALVSPTESPLHELPPLSHSDANGHLSDEKVHGTSNGRIGD